MYVRLRSETPGLRKGALALHLIVSVGLGTTLVHSVGGLVVLLVILVLNLYKPRGLTRYGWRKQQNTHTSSDREPTPPLEDSKARRSRANPGG